ncbi:hypothetical protein [Parasediminibacterium sp. JCM 36343]|uniref:hypothetical protein n=1 Tax=Parasediminibacterium sp. JCM 36343 TaxID=3374279 RepID=UPI00397D299E
MKKSRLMFSIMLLAIGSVCNAQNKRSASQLESPKLIAVVNSANWCMVCKDNAQRFEAVLMPYAVKGVKIYINDLSNDTTKPASKTELENANIYKAVTTVARKGMGKMLQSCGLVKGKKQSSEVSGIVTFVSPITHKMLKQLSISVSDDEMKTTIDSLLN